MKVEPGKLLMFKFGKTHQKKFYALKLDIIIPEMGEKVGLSKSGARRMLKQGGITIFITNDSVLDKFKKDE